MAKESESRYFKNQNLDSLGIEIKPTSSPFSLSPVPKSGATTRPLIRVHHRGGMIPQNRELWIAIPSACSCNWESENDSFLILFTIPLIPILVPIPPKCAKESESRFLGIRIAILRNQNRDS